MEEREQSTVPAGLTLRDAVSLLEAPGYDTADPIETAHVPLGWLVMGIPLTLMVGAAYVIWQATKTLSLQLP